MTAKTFIIDFDSTILTGESLDELAALALRGHPERAQRLAEIEAITLKAMAGELPYYEALHSKMRLFSAAKTHLQELSKELSRQITPSFWRHRDWLRKHADTIWVISGGFEECIVPIVARLGIAADHVMANAFLFNTAGDIVGCDDQRFLAHTGGKVALVEALNLPRPIVAIGDGYTDYEIRAKGQADEFWAFCENARRPTVVEVADRVLDSFDEVAAL